MVAINPEMLRELLEEFTEKEEVTREEMNAINQQIAELEKRIEASKIKLAGLNKDRDKVNAMRERYLSGNWRLQLSNMAANQSVEAAPVEPAAAVPISAAPATAAEGRAARRAAREAANQSSASPFGESTPAGQSIVEATAPMPTGSVEPVAEFVAEPVFEPGPEPVFQEVQAANQYDHSSDQADEQAYEPAYEQTVETEAPSIEHAPADDPIMSSFNSAPLHAPDVASALAQTPAAAPVAFEQPGAPDLESSGFSWSSTAINAVDQAQGQASAPSYPPSSQLPSQAAAPGPGLPDNPWGAQAPSQPQSTADIWGHPENAQSPQISAPATSPEPQQAAGWGDFGEDWQMKEAEGQRNTANNIPVVQALPQAPAEAPADTTAGWGQAASPWGAPQAPADAGGGGWGRPTASRQNMPAMAAPNSALNPANAGFNASQAPNLFQAQNPAALPEAQPAAGDWGRSAQPPGNMANAGGAGGWAGQGSPWGDAAAQGQSPQGMQSPQAPAPLGASVFEQQAAESEAAANPSSLARAADGALISPVKGRRRAQGTPAAFDWGQPEQGSAQDPNQTGNPEDPNDGKKIDDVLKGLFK